MYQDKSGRWRANVTTNDGELVEKIEEYLDNHPDTNLSELFRRAVRRELQREMTDNAD